jgi:hypothetical protein
LLHFSARRDANIDAARWGDLPAVRGLRRDRLDQDLDGLVLHRAARGHTEVVAFLLEERHDLRVAAGCCPVQVPLDLSSQVPVFKVPLKFNSVILGRGCKKIRV